MNAACGGPTWRLSTLHVAWFSLYLKQIGWCYVKSEIAHMAWISNFTRDAPWQKMLIDDLITLVTWPMFIVQTRNHFVISEKIEKRRLNRLLLSRRFTGESFRLLPSLNRKIDMVLAFPRNSCLVSFDCLKNEILRACTLHMISKCFWIKFVH